jgi:radical SAM protein with 4Fe4S-binding SPASM domain
MTERLPDDFLDLPTSRQSTSFAKAGFMTRSQYYSMGRTPVPEVERRGYIRIDLANNCNIRCIMCQAYNSLPVNAVKFLDYDVFTSRTSGELGKWECIQLGNVAEATIHPRFADILRYVRAEAPGSTIYIVTNGKTLQKFAPLINELGNCLVQISMDSVRKDVHEYIREGSKFDRAMENIAMLDTRRTRVRMAFTLMKSNIGDYAEMLEFCRARDYELSAFPMIVRAEKGVVPFNLLKESLWFSREALQQWLRDFYGIQYGKIIGTASGAAQGADEFTCNAHYSDLSMDALGIVHLCGKLTLGDLHRETLKSLWQGEVAEDFRRQVETGRGPCMTCDYRQRCLSPSMALIDNHFSEELIHALPEETRHAIGYERTISDDEALWRYVRDMGGVLGISDIGRDGDRWSARRVSAAPDPCKYEYGAPLEADSRHELYEEMHRQTKTELHPAFLEHYGRYNLVAYRRRFWALPAAHGYLDLTHEGDRGRDGIVAADTLADLKGLCAPEVPRLLGSLNGYNLVEYLGQFWGIPQAFGPFDLTDSPNQSRTGLVAAHSLAGLHRKCGGLLNILESD